MLAETYYSIRIGDPKRHRPYLMLDHDRNIPLIFPKKQDALDTLNANTGANRKVVRVKITYAG